MLTEYNGFKLGDRVRCKFDMDEGIIKYIDKDGWDIPFCVTIFVQFILAVINGHWLAVYPKYKEI